MDTPAEERPCSPAGVVWTVMLESYESVGLDLLKCLAAGSIPLHVVVLGHTMVADPAASIAGAQLGTRLAYFGEDRFIRLSTLGVVYA